MPRIRRLEVDGLFRRASPYLALQSAHLLAPQTAKGHGLLHDAVKPMTGATTESEVRALRRASSACGRCSSGSTPARQEFEAKTPCSHSTYEAPSFSGPESASA